MDATDRVTEMLVDALKRALALPGEHRLYRAGKLDGLFPGRGSACVEAAERAVRDGLLERLRVEVRGKTETEWVRATPRAVEFLHEHESPLCALHELRDALRCNREAVPLWLDAMRSTLRELEAKLTADAAGWAARLEAMEGRVADTLRRLEAAGPLVPAEVLEWHPWAVDALNYLDRRESAGAAEPCPLPELFTAVSGHHAGLSLGRFHDGLRRLHQRRAVRLLPAGDAMARPEFALLEGDGVYYRVAR